MTLTMDPGASQVREYTCPCCNAPIQRTWNYVESDGDPFAVYFANCYHHKDQPHEAWIDVILGTWGDDTATDHVTFGCRVGPVVDGPEPAATLVQACLDGSRSPIHGHLLTRDEGLAHPWLPEFWRVIDLVLTEDALVRSHIYGS